MKNYYLYGFCRNLSLTELNVLRLDIKKQIGEYHYGKKMDSRVGVLIKDLKIVKRQIAIRQLDFLSKFEEEQNYTGDEGFYESQSS